MVSPGSDNTTTDRHCLCAPRWLVRGVLALLCLGVLAGRPVSARQAAEPELPKPNVDKQPKASEGPDILPAEYGAGLQASLPVTLRDVLKLALLENLDIAQARLLVQRSRANLAIIRSRYLPNINLGGTYTTHDGQIQNTAGNVQTVNRDSLFVGLGTSWSVPIADALFAPAEGLRLLNAIRIGQVRVTNDTLLRVSDAYLAVLQARRRLAAIEEGLDFLSSTEEHDSRGGSQGLLPLIRSFVRSGNALPSDQIRVEVDIVRLREERIRILEELRVTSAELARLLNLDPTQLLMPADNFRALLPIAADAWAASPMEVLLGQAFRSRPELAENNSLREAAVARYKATRWQPYLPTLAVNYQWGGFGGGPGVVGRTATGGNILGHSGTIADFGQRGDFDISLLWRLQGLGLGNRALQQDARLRIDQTLVQQVQLQNQVVSQVVRALESVRRGKERVAIVGASLFDEQGKPTGAVYRAIRLNFLRIKGGQGTPLEVLDSIRRLVDILNAYNLALTSSDQARYRLLVRLGLPTPALVDPACVPQPPAPPAIQPEPLPTLPAPKEKEAAQGKPPVDAYFLSLAESAANRAPQPQPNTAVEPPGGWNLPAPVTPPLPESVKSDSIHLAPSADSPAVGDPGKRVGPPSPRPAVRIRALDDGLGAVPVSAPSTPPSP